MKSLSFNHRFFWILASLTVSLLFGMSVGIWASGDAQQSPATPQVHSSASGIEFVRAETNNDAGDYQFRIFLRNKSSLPVTSLVIGAGDSLNIFDYITSPNPELFQPQETRVFSFGSNEVSNGNSIRVVMAGYSDGTVEGDAAYAPYFRAARNGFRQQLEAFLPIVEQQLDAVRNGRARAKNVARDLRALAKALPKRNNQAEATSERQTEATREQQSIESGLNTASSTFDVQLGQIEQSVNSDSDQDVGIKLDRFLQTLRSIRTKLH